MPNFFNNTLHRFDDHTRELLCGASIAFMLKVLAAGLGFALNVVLARLLGVEGSGIFFLAFTIVLVVAAIGRLGMENALIKFIAANIAIGQTGKVLGVYRKAIGYSFCMAIILSTLLYLLSPWMSQTLFSKPNLEQPLSIMAIAVVPLALLTLSAQALQGLKEIAISISVLSVFVPLLTISFSLIFVPYYGIKAAAWGYLIATFVTLLFARWSWRRSIPIFNGVESTPQFDRKELLASSMPLFGIVMMNMVISWSPMLFLGIWESDENIGIYSAASRTAMLTSFVLIAINSIAAPKFAELYKQGDLKTLENIVQNSTKTIIFLSLPILMIFLLAPELIMSVFGREFIQGSYVLMILAIGQFINTSTGSVGYLLMMTDNEKLMRNIMVICAFLGLTLNFWLIPNYGIVGGAIAAAVILSLQNIIAMVMVSRKLKIMTLPWLKLS